DVISIHVSATAQTSPLLGAADLARVRDGATLVNTARGRIIDQDALVAELATGRIDAVLDVTEPEDLAPDHLLHELPTVVLTPHIAGSMGRELHRLADRSIQALRDHLSVRRGQLTATPAVTPAGHPPRRHHAPIPLEFPTEDRMSTTSRRQFLAGSISATGAIALGASSCSVLSGEGEAAGSAADGQEATLPTHIEASDPQVEAYYVSDVDE